MRGVEPAKNTIYCLNVTYTHTALCTYKDLTRKYNIHDVCMYVYNIICIYRCQHLHIILYYIVADGELAQRMR